MALVFISYSRKDAAFVNRLVGDLRARQVPIWLDRAALTGGAEWLAAIENALEDATHLVLVMSPASNRSKFVRKEALYALEEGKNVIPIRIAPCKPPLLARDLQYIDFVEESYEAAFTRLLAALPQVGEESPAGEPAPERYTRFWAALQSRARPRIHLHDHLKPPRRNMLVASPGCPGVRYAYVLGRREAGVQVIIDRRDAAGSKALFDMLATSRPAIETAFGSPLRWERLERHRRCRVGWMTPIAPLEVEANWPAVQDVLIAAMIRLAAAFGPHLTALPRG
ncbi:MAG: DUF4268 domain-containing protein [Anaerolineae bacterium]|nr:DUF4268 domain-containing protein [Anaerolineae bacterium]